MIGPNLHRDNAAEKVLRAAQWLANRVVRCYLALCRRWAFSGEPARNLS